MSEKQRGGQWFVSGTRLGEPVAYARSNCPAHINLELVANCARWWSPCGYFDSAAEAMSACDASLLAAGWLLESPAR